MSLLEGFVRIFLGSLVISPIYWHKWFVCSGWVKTHWSQVRMFLLIYRFKPKRWPKNTWFPVRESSCGQERRVLEEKKRKEEEERRIVEEKKRREDEVCVFSNRNSCLFFVTNWLTFWDGENIRDPELKGESWPPKIEGGQGRMAVFFFFSQGFQDQQLLCFGGSFHGEFSWLRPLGRHFFGMQFILEVF